MNSEEESLTDLQKVYLLLRARLLKQARDIGDDDEDKAMQVVKRVRKDLSVHLSAPEDVAMVARTLTSPLSGAVMTLYSLDSLDAHVLLNYAESHALSLLRLFTREEDMRRQLRDGPNDPFLWTPPPRLLITSNMAVHFSEAEVQDGKRARAKEVRRLLEVDYAAWVASLPNRPARRNNSLSPALHEQLSLPRTVPVTLLSSSSPAAAAENDTKRRAASRRGAGRESLKVEDIPQPEAAKDWDDQLEQSIRALAQRIPVFPPRVDPRRVREVLADLEHSTQGEVAQEQKFDVLLGKQVEKLKTAFLELWHAVWPF